MARKFLTLTEQLEFIKKEKNISYDADDIVRLMREGYFNVFTNYKYPFIIGNNEEGYTIFDKNIKLKHILALKDFDDYLRITLLEYIVKVEQEIRAVTSYLFDKYNNNGQVKWNDPRAYDIANIPVAKLQSLVRRIENDMKNNDNEDINEYITKHQVIPTWAMIQGIAFSTLQIFIRDTRKEVKKELVRIYQFKDQYEVFSFDLFDRSFDLLRDVRNKCAHNERTYCFVNQDQIFEEKIYSELKCKGMLTHPNECRVINAIIYIRYYLTTEEYEKFINRIKNGLGDLRKKISKKAYERVLEIMGFASMDVFKTILEIPVIKVFKF